MLLPTVSSKTELHLRMLQQVFDLSHTGWSDYRLVFSGLIDTTETPRLLEGFLKRAWKAANVIVRSC